MIQDSYPDLDFEFVDLGISGNRTEHLVARLEADFIEIQPDIVSVMIGINDVWHHYSHGIETSDEQFEQNYRVVLDAIKTRTSARILMIQPFLLETVDPAKQAYTEELARKQAIVKKLADEYADAYLPLDEILHSETEEEPAYYAADGVHPTPDGACFIGEAYLGAIAKLIELLS
jgi:lysophospholipase L1-like esterase